MRFNLESREYRRRFRVPLQTARGTCAVRRGIVLRLEDVDGRVGYGEVAPLAGFGTETLEEADQYLASLREQWDGGLPAGLPCCSFALRCARSCMEGAFDRPPVQLACAALLPAGQAALAAQQARLKKGYKVFKWKAGTCDIATELELATELAAHGTLRVDANGGLDPPQARAWLNHLDALANVEFLEQPLPKGRWRECLALTEAFKTPIALDEDAPKATGWPGLTIVKPALGRATLGDVYSSALETSVGKEMALRMAVDSVRAVGFGVGDLFDNDGLDLHGTGPEIEAGSIGNLEMKAIWERI